MIKLINPMSQCSAGKLKMPAGKSTIFTILKIKLDDLLLEKKLYLVIKNLHLSWLFNPTFGVQIKSAANFFRILLKLYFRLIANQVWSQYQWNDKLALNKNALAQ